MRCSKCGWPLRLLGTRKVLTHYLASFRCMNSHCQHERTEIGRT
jgi:hypothetical protein